MADLVTPEKRSIMMRGIRGKNTAPELMIRRALHAAGYRYRIHDKKIAGNPDLIFPKYRAVIFIHGCFWHCHNCHLFKWPKSRTEFWTKKILSNRERDKKNIPSLQAEGWRTLVVWECALKGRTRLELGLIISQISNWLTGSEMNKEIMGKELTFL